MVLANESRESECSHNGPYKWFISHNQILFSLYLEVWFQISIFLKRTLLCGEAVIEGLLCFMKFESDSEKQENPKNVSITVLPLYSNACVFKKKQVWLRSPRDFPAKFSQKRSNEKLIFYPRMWNRIVRLFTKLHVFWFMSVIKLTFLCKFSMILNNNVSLDFLLHIKKFDCRFFSVSLARKSCYSERKSEVANNTDFFP